jgi:2-polyprenyl-3-methyl-5-hydroxy-6-metoxy-1,4-benzoquinol methylase
MTSTCGICGSGRFKPFMSNGLRDFQFGVPFTGDIRKCLNCEMVQQYPALTREQAFAYYPDEYAHYHPDKSRLRAFLVRLYFRKMVALLKSLGAKPGDRLLDIGAGCGEKAAHLRRALGVEIIGIEPNVTAAQSAGEVFGINVLNGFFPDPRIQKKSFRFVYINHVIEHVPDPVAFLNDIHEALVPGGWVIGETENIESLSFRFFRRYWSLLHMPYHLYFFTRASLAATFQRAAFGAVKITHDIDPSAWTLSTINFLRRHQARPRAAQKIPGYKALLLAGAAFAQLERQNGPVLRFAAQAQ